MKLIITNGQRAGESYKLTPPHLSIGRETNNEISLLEEGISRYHARIEETPSGWMIKDLGSTNGTRINSELINKPTKISPGDLLTLGDINIKVQKRKTLPDTSENTNDTEQEDTRERIPKAVEAPGLETATARISKISGIKGPSVLSSDDFLSDENAQHPQHQKLPPRTKHTEEKKKSKAGLFFVLMIILCTSGAGAYYYYPQLLKPAASQIKIDTTLPFIVHYTRHTIEKGSIFRCELKIQDTFVELTLDDTRTGRSLQYNYFLSTRDIKELQNSIEETSFFSLIPITHGKAIDGKNDTRTIMIGYNNELSNISVANTSSPTPFLKTERLISDFADEFLSINIGELTEQETIADIKRSIYITESAGSEIPQMRAIEKLLRLKLVYSSYPEMEEYDELRKKLTAKIFQASTELEKIITEQAQKCADYLQVSDLKNAEAASTLLLQMLIRLNDPRTGQEESRLSMIKRERKKAVVQ